MDIWTNYLLAFLPIFVAVDALGTVPIFLSLTRGLSQGQKDILLRRSILTAMGVALGFIWLGRLVFSLLGITISDFLVAGGAILFILSIRDLLSSSKTSAIPEETMGVIPLAMPLIVGPAVLTTSLILLNSFGFYPTFVSLVVNIILCGVILHFSSIIGRLLGENGSNTLSKIFSLLLAAIGVMLMRKGLYAIFISGAQ